MDVIRKIYGRLRGHHVSFNFEKLSIIGCKINGPPQKYSIWFNVNLKVVNKTLNTFERKWNFHTSHGFNHKLKALKDEWGKSCLEKDSASALNGWRFGESNRF